MNDTIAEAESLLEHMCNLDFDSPTNLRRNTSIICTIARNSQSVDVLQRMIMEGMDIVRLNFSHDSHQFHAESVANFHEAYNRATKELGYQKHVALALDLKGPEIRTGLIDSSGRNESEVEVKKNDNLRLSINKDLIDKGNRECIYIDYPRIIELVMPGNIIYVNDGQILLVVKEVAVDCVICVVEVGGMLGSRQGVCLPGVPIDLPPVSEKDRFDLKFGVDHNVDFVFTSRIRTPLAIKEIRTILGEKGKYVKIIAKIESQQILQQLDEIIAASDGIIIDRGDLSVEIASEKVFVIQKAIIARCNRVGKPVVCATQILESMRVSARPKRAEVSDLGNAVIDGVDCVMLSSESAIGSHPIKAVVTMNNICREAECCLWYRKLYNDILAQNPAALDAAHAVAISAVDAANKSMAAAIVVLTTSGKSSNLLSRYRPRCPIIAVTRCPRTARQSHMYRGIIPVLYTEPANEDWIKDVEARVQYALFVGKKINVVNVGDAVVVVSPWKDGTGFTNNMRVAYAFFEQEPLDCLFKKDAKMASKVEHNSVL